MFWILQFLNIFKFLKSGSKGQILYDFYKIFKFKNPIFTYSTISRQIGYTILQCSGVSSGGGGGQGGDPPRLKI